MKDAMIASQFLEIQSDKWFSCILFPIDNHHIDREFAVFGLVSVSLIGVEPPPTDAGD
jgi:hypothetical protein